MNIKLNKTYRISGKDINEIELDFDSLSGFDVVEAEKEYKKRNKGSSMKELEDGWYLTIAEKASKIKYGDFLKLNIKDYMKVVNEVRNFLLVSDSAETTENLEKEEMEVAEEETKTEE